MNKIDREIYRVLSSEADFCLCSFCRFSKSFNCGELQCKHPLSDRLESLYPYEGKSPGDDCWGFRPSYDVPNTADIVGIILAEGWEVASWYENEERQLVVSGIKDW